MGGKRWTPEEEALLAQRCGRECPQTGEEWDALAKDLRLPRTGNQCRLKWRYMGVRDPQRAVWSGPHDRLLKLVIKRPRTLSELTTIFDEKPSEILRIIQELRDRGVIIQEDPRTSTVRVPPTPPTPVKFPPAFERTVSILRFGAVSDTHFGSNEEQPSALHHVVEYMYSKGIRRIFHAGDLGHGRGVYRGQETESYAYTWETQIEATIARLPQKPDLRWYIIGGNHDYSFWKLMGGDFVSAVARRRDDVIACGYDAATVPLLRNPPVDLHLWHGRGGGAYAASYPVQKYAERGLIPFEELAKIVGGLKDRPTIRVMLVGHYHRVMYMPIGAMHCWMPGAFEGRNSLAKRAGLWPVIGGFIITLHIDNKGMVIGLEQEWVPGFLVGQDYTNFPIPCGDLVIESQDVVFSHPQPLGEVTVE